MNSKMVHDTEDKIAYNFFESVINLRESIAEALMKAEKVNSSINEQISSYGFELLDEKLPDLGVTLNNKLVEIYQQFKESKVKVFQSQDKNKKFVIGLVPMLVINSLIERAVDAYRNEMGLYLQEAEGLQEQKEKNKEKIKEKSFITVLIIAIRTVFNEELAKKFYFDEAEVEDLRTKLEDYKKATEDIYNYDFKTDIIDIFEAINNETLSELDIEWSEKACACVIMASGGYPKSYKKGVEITGLTLGQLDGVTVYHAGTKIENDKLVTSGGRVLGVTALGDSLADALKKSYEAVENIHFDNAHYRKDIGKRALEANK